jgi:hypothetical protein
MPSSTLALASGDASLLGQLNAWCARPDDSAPIEVLLALADGRSAREMADLVMTNYSCPMRAVSWGRGADEVLTLSSYSKAGVILWVDQGWWRAARLPFGLGYGVAADRRVDGVRELVLGLDSGGSGGGIGIVVVRIVGSRLSVALVAQPGASHIGTVILDDDHILMTGRKLPDRPWGWTQNCCMPGGHEWLYVRRAGGFALVAERQAIGPVFALNAFVGAMAAGRADLAADVGTPTAITDADRLITQAQYWVGDSSLLGQEESNEALRWLALPNPMQLERRDVSATVMHYGTSGIVDRQYIATLGFVDGGWRVKTLGLAKIGGPH